MLRRVAQSRRAVLRYYDSSRLRTIGTGINRIFSTQNGTMGEQRETDDAFEKMEQEGVPKCPEPTKVAAEAKTEELPKMSPQEFRQWNHMSEHMDMFHENFRRTWNTLYAAASSNKRPQGMSIRQFLATILEFTHHLTIHHTIEERHIFPVLARRMDIFKEEGRHLEQHKGIHAGVDALEAFVADVRSGEKEFNLRELKGVMDGFGEVLWTHLDEEVKTLGAENMRKYWSLDEMRRMPM